jgi:uncharacterized protein YndB with AHSA1/START domain
MADASVLIERPVGEVFDFLTDAENTGTWFPARVREAWTSPPPRGVGSTRRAWVRMLGRESVNDGVVTEYDPPARAAIRIDAAGIALTMTLSFEPIGGATRASVAFDAVGRGVARLAVPPFLAWYRRSWQRGLVTAKQLMETADHHGPQARVR